MKQKFFKKPLNVVLIAIFCTALWGSAAPFIKTGYALFDIASNDTASILVFAGLRFTLAGVLVIVAGSKIQNKILLPVKKSIKAIFVLSIFQTMGQYFFYYVGLAHTSGVNGAIITGTGAFISLLVAALVFKYERMDLNKVTGCMLGFMGIVLMNMDDFASLKVSFLGDGLVLCSQLCSSFSASFIKKYTQSFNAVMLSGYQFFVGGILLILIGILMGGSLLLTNISGMMVLIYLAFVSACAYTLWGILLSYHPVSKIGIFNCLIPVVGVILSSLILHEEAFSMNIVFALIFISFGIYFVSKEKDPLTMDAS